MRVEARTFGEWAAHRSPHIVSGDDWRVTHVPSGCDLARLVDGLTEVDACLIAQLLAERVPSLGLSRLAKDSAPPLPYEIQRIVEATVAEAIAEP